jgi:hypothetical protein
MTIVKTSEVAAGFSLRQKMKRNLKVAATINLEYGICDWNLDLQ